MNNYSRCLVLHRIGFLRGKMLVEDSKGQVIFHVIPKRFAMGKTYVITDPIGNEIAKIKQCISLIVPKFKIIIENKKTIYITRKISLYHDYVISGIPWKAEGDFSGFKYQVTDDNGNVIFEIDKAMNRWDSRYALTVYCDEYMIHGVCMAIAIDAAIATIAASRKNN